MDFASSTRAVVANSSVVPYDLPRLWDRIEKNRMIFIFILKILRVIIRIGSIRRF